MHVTRSPTASLCLGAFKKKSFTRSLYPTRYILWEIFWGGFLSLNVSQIFRRRSKTCLAPASGTMHNAGTYIPGRGEEGGTSFYMSSFYMSKECQTYAVNLSHLYYIYHSLSHNCIRIRLSEHSTR